MLNVKGWVAAVLILNARIAVAAADAGDWRTLVRRAQEQEQSGQYQAAYETLRAALRVAEQSRLPKALAVSLNNAGSVALELGLYRDAEQYLRQSIRQWELAGDSGENRHRPMNNLAALHKAIGQTSKAEQIYRQVLEIRLRILGPRHLDVARVLNNIGSLEVVRGNLDRGEARPLEAMHILIDGESDAPSGLDSVRANLLGSIQVNLSSGYLDREDYPRATKMASSAVNVFETNFGLAHPKLIEPLIVLAKATLRMGDSAAPTEALQRAEAIVKTALGETNPAMAPVLLAKAELLARQGNKGKAKLLRAQAGQALARNRRQNLLDFTVDVESFRPSR